MPLRFRTDTRGEWNALTDYELKKPHPFYPAWKTIEFAPGVPYYLEIVIPRADSGAWPLAYCPTTSVRARAREAQPDWSPQYSTAPITSNWYFFINTA
jgi:hypothetical protein